jgi:hypothetical protein
MLLKEARRASSGMHGTQGPHPRTGPTDRELPGGAPPGQPRYFKHQAACTDKTGSACGPHLSQACFCESR